MKTFSIIVFTAAYTLMAACAFGALRLNDDRIGRPYSGNDLLAAAIWPLPVLVIGLTTVFLDDAGRFDSGFHYKAAAP